MRFVSTIFLILLLPLVGSKAWADDANSTDKATKRTPTTLAEAHSELERILPSEELAKIDAMKSEKDMIEYHFGLGLYIRNNWGLWRGSPLSKHLNELGFTHPDDMSAVILETFWCKRHGQPFRLSERAAEFSAYWEASRKAQADEEKRVVAAKKKMRSMMMEITLINRNASTIMMPPRIDSEIRARYLAQYNDGVLIGVRKDTGRRDATFVTEPYFFSSKDGMIHKVNIPELQEFDSVVLAGRTVWICGTCNGANILLGITADQRIKQSLPKEGSLPQLGLHNESLLAVYPKSVYKLVDGEWKMIYEGDTSLPRSGPPPRLIGDTLYLRDEGSGENMKRLWLLKIGENHKLVSLDKDTGVVGPNGPRWENSFSYAATDSGDFWACVGESSNRKSLLHRSKDGAYSIAIMNNSVKFTPDLFGSAGTDQGLSVSAVTLLQDGTVLLVGDSGLYRLNKDALTQEVAFTNTQQEIPINGGKNIYHWGWDPSDILVLKKDSYFISGAFGGIYILYKDEARGWTFNSLDEKLGKPLTW